MTKYLLLIPINFALSCLLFFSTVTSRLYSFKDGIAFAVPFVIGALFYRLVSRIGV